MLELDHIAVAARTLDEGRAVVEDALGVALQPGGHHAHFGTHNLLLGLEDGLYLEVIAVDPEAPAPDYPRWFDLDRFEGRPRPQTWICWTRDMGSFVEAYPQAGVPVVLSRAALRWQMAVPANGILPYDNAFPAVIEWQCADHPARMLAPTGVTLERLEVSHPEARALAAELAPVFNDSRVVFEIGAQATRLMFATPHGRRVLE